MTTEIVAATAYELDMAIHQCNLNVRANFLRMAELLVQMREERLYRSLDYDTFESYLGSLGAEGTRGWLYKLIRAWEVFSKKMEIPDQTLIAIGPSKLDIIAPMAPAMMLDEHHKADWIGKAEELSKSDLINEVRQCQGKPLLSSLTAPTGHIYPGLSDLLKFKSYTEYVKNSPCMICGARPVDAHHFPKTIGAGAKLDWVVPLCREDHSAYHYNPLKFMHDFSGNWAAYFYGLILKIWEKC